MKVVSLALLYLGSISFFGVEAAKLDIASDFKRKWNSWRARRDETVLPLTVAQAAALDDKPAAGVRRPARSLDSSLRAKRIQLPNDDVDVHLQSVRHLCGFGTCTVHNLAHLLNQYMNKDKDVSPPPWALGPQGIGRRRRRSVRDTVGTLAGLGPASQLRL